MLDAVNHVENNLKAMQCDAKTAEALETNLSNGRPVSLQQFYSKCSSGAFGNVTHEAKAELMFTEDATYTIKPSALHSQSHILLLPIPKVNVEGGGGGDARATQHLEDSSECSDNWSTKIIEQIQTLKTIGQPLTDVNLFLNNLRSSVIQNCDASDLFGFPKLSNLNQIYPCSVIESAPRVFNLSDVGARLFELALCSAPIIILDDYENGDVRFCLLSNIDIAELVLKFKPTFENYLRVQTKSNESLDNMSLFTAFEVLKLIVNDINWAPGEKVIDCLDERTKLGVFLATNKFSAIQLLRYICIVNADVLANETYFRFLKELGTVMRELTVLQSFSWKVCYSPLKERCISAYEAIHRLGTRLYMSDIHSLTHLNAHGFDIRDTLTSLYTKESNIKIICVRSSILANELPSCLDTKHAEFMNIFDNFRNVIDNANDFVPMFNLQISFFNSIMREYILGNMSAKSLKSEFGSSFLTCLMLSYAVMASFPADTTDHNLDDISLTDLDLESPDLFTIMFDSDALSYDIEQRAKQLYRIKPKYTKLELAVLLETSLKSSGTSLDDFIEKYVVYSDGGYVVKALNLMKIS